MDKEYILTMSIIKSLLDKGTIDKEEYDSLLLYFKEKYSPTLCILFE